jgi:integrase
MSVRKRKWTTRSGEAKEAWIVDYAQDGQRHIETFKRKKDADVYGQQVGVDIRAGTHTPVSKSITVAKAADNWIDYIKGEGRERSTQAQYRQHAKHINARLGNVKLANLTTPRINTFRDELLKGSDKLPPMSRPMARKVLTSLKSILRDAQRRGSVAQNVALSVKIGVSKRDKRTLKIGVDIPTRDEIKLIIHTASGRLKVLLLTAVFTGLRASELRGLRWQDINLKKGVLEVSQRADRYNEIGEPKSEAGGRAIPIPPPLLGTLKEWRLKCPHGKRGLVFPTRKGEIEHHSNIVRALQPVVIAAGCTVSVRDDDGNPMQDKDGKPIVAAKYTGLHALRHFYASWCINRKKDGGLELPAKIVQARLGHASIVMTMDRYGICSRAMTTAVSWRKLRTRCWRDHLLCATQTGHVAFFCTLSAEISRSYQS